MSVAHCVSHSAPPPFPPLAPRCHIGSVMGRCPLNRVVGPSHQVKLVAEQISVGPISPPSEDYRTLILASCSQSFLKLLAQWKVVQSANVKLKLGSPISLRSDCFLAACTSSSNSSSSSSTSSSNLSWHCKRNMAPVSKTVLSVESSSFLSSIAFLLSLWLKKTHWSWACGVPWFLGPVVTL